MNAIWRWIRESAEKCKTELVIFETESLDKEFCFAAINILRDAGYEIELDIDDNNELVITIKW
jgi:predicted  nucleic acid-binding Zn-ribbon protein